MKLTENEKEMLWGGGDGPYSEAKIVINSRILDDGVSRVMIEVEGFINPTTFKMVKKHAEEFEDDEMVLGILQNAEYAGKGNGYQISLGCQEYRDQETMREAKARLEIMKEGIIRMHRFVMKKLEG